MKTQIMSFGGKNYLYMLCPKCEVWIWKEDFRNNTHKNCKKYKKSLDVRRQAEKQVLGMLNKVLKK